MSELPVNIKHSVDVIMSDERFPFPFHGFFRG